LYSKDKNTLIAYPAGKTETSFIIPDGVTSIDSWVFSFCANLTCVTIPDSVTSIGFEAFCHCDSLASVTIPESVASIENKAFADCTGLVSVTFQGTIPSSGFNNDPNDPTFPGDLREKFYATNKKNGTPGTYTRKKRGKKWTRQ
jgi:hypothetical protein